MKNNKYCDLVRYARRRNSLSGTQYAKTAFPYHQPVAELGDGNMTSFAAYDYLGLRNDPRILEAAHDTISSVGVGAHASRIVGGNLRLHEQLEAEMSRFLGTDDTLLLVSGFGTNVAVLAHMLMKGDLTVLDESCHNSIMMGTQTSRAGKSTFRHNDLDHLEWIFANDGAGAQRKLVVVEGLYSMDGDIPDLPKLIALCRDHNAWLMVDEAHSIGVMGKRGAGITEHFGIPRSEVDLIVGTLSKAFLTCGGFVSARQPVIDWLRATLPGYVFSVGVPPINAAVSHRALQILCEEPERLVLMHHNSQYFMRAAQRIGLNVGCAIGAPVIPVLFPTIPETVEAANIALEAGYYVSPIIQIAVPTDAPRLRFFVTVGHSKAEMDGVLEALSPLGTTRHKEHMSSPRSNVPPPSIDEVDHGYSVAARL